MQSNLPSSETYEPLSSSIQNSDFYGSVNQIFPSSITSESSGDSGIKMRNYGLPIHRAVVVVANAALGAGMLNFPQAYEKTGGLLNALSVQTVSRVRVGF